MNIQAFLSVIMSVFLSIITVSLPAVQTQIRSEFVFKMNLQEVRRIMIDNLESYPGYKYMRLDYRERSVILSSNAKFILSQKNNFNDLYLHKTTPISKSLIYVDKAGNSLEYYADLVIHLTEVGGNTHVQIRTINPVVVIGKAIFPSFPHLVRSDISKPVPASPLEERDLLINLVKMIDKDTILMPLKPSDRIIIK